MRSTQEEEAARSTQEEEEERSTRKEERSAHAWQEGSGS